MSPYSTSGRIDFLLTRRAAFFVKYRLTFLSCCNLMDTLFIVFCKCVSKFKHSSNLTPRYLKVVTLSIVILSDLMPRLFALMRLFRFEILLPKTMYLVFLGFMKIPFFWHHSFRLLRSA